VATSPCSSLVYVFFVPRSFDSRTLQRIIAVRDKDDYYPNIRAMCVTTRSNLLVVSTEMTRQRKEPSSPARARHYGAIFVYDVNTGDLIHRIDSKHFSGKLYGITPVHHHGSLVLVSDFDNDAVYVVDAYSGQFVHSLDFDCKVKRPFGIVLSRKSNILYISEPWESQIRSFKLDTTSGTASYIGTFTKTDKHLDEKHPDGPHLDDPESIALSYDCKYLIVAEPARWRISLFDAKTHSFIRVLPAHAVRPQSISILPHNVIVYVHDGCVSFLITRQVADMLVELNRQHYQLHVSTDRSARVRAHIPDWNAIDQQAHGSRRTLQEHPDALRVFEHVFTNMRLIDDCRRELDTIIIGNARHVSDSMEYFSAVQMLPTSVRSARKRNYANQRQHAMAERVERLQKEASEAIGSIIDADQGQQLIDEHELRTAKLTRILTRIAYKVCKHMCARIVMLKAGIAMEFDQICQSTTHMQHTVDTAGATMHHPQEAKTAMAIVTTLITSIQACMQLLASTSDSTVPRSVIADNKMKTFVNNATQRLDEAIILASQLKF
jgi:hypothetical protein